MLTPQGKNKDVVERNKDAGAANRRTQGLELLVVEVANKEGLLERIVAILLNELIFGYVSYLFFIVTMLSFEYRQLGRIHPFVSH